MMEQKQKLLVAEQGILDFVLLNSLNCTQLSELKSLNCIPNDGPLDLTLACTRRR